MKTPPLFLFRKEKLEKFLEINMIREKHKYQEQSDKARIAMDETEQFHVKKIDPNFSKQLIQYRLDRKWKRPDLARFLNEKESVIASLENGTMVHDGKLIHKIRQKLKI